MTQKEQVLCTFKLRPVMTTAQLHQLPYITNVRARISDLRKDGHLIVAHKIEGKHQSSFHYLGQAEPVQMVPDVRSLQWHPLPNSFEVLY